MMKSLTLDELDSVLAQDAEYVAAERRLRPDLNLANDVIALRVEAGWSQAKLATRVGTNQANISRLESARANPTVKFLKKVAQALGAELDIRLRRPDDLAGADSLESVVAKLDVKAITATEQRPTVMQWQFLSESAVTYQVSTQSSRTC